MGTIIGILLIAVAASTVVGVLYMVLREPQVHEEYYIPPPKSPTPEASAPPKTTAEAPAPSPNDETTVIETPDTPA